MQDQAQNKPEAEKASLDDLLDEMEDFIQFCLPDDAKAEAQVGEKNGTIGSLVQELASPMETELSSSTSSTAVLDPVACLTAEEAMKKGMDCLSLSQYTSARKYFEEIDCPQANLYLGNIYENGYGVAKDIEKANSYYEKAGAITAWLEQDPNHPRKRFYLGAYYVYFTKKFEQALSHLSFADEHGDMDAPYLLGGYYLEIVKTKEGDNKAVQLFRKAISRKNPNARYELAKHYLSTTPKKAEKELREGVGLQESGAQCGLALFYSTHANKNLKKIAELYEAAANQGDAIAQYHTGECYLKGHGVAKNVDTAITWFTSAAEQGHAQVQCELGKVYLHSIGDRKPDYEKAIKWLTLAATKEHGEACFTLGKIYFVGFDGKGPNYGEAIKWFKLAVKHECFEALPYLQKCQAKINVLGHDQTKSEDKAMEAEGSLPGSSVQLIGQVESESSSVSSVTGLLLSPVELSPQQVEGLLLRMLQSNVEKVRAPGPKDLSLGIFSSSSGSSNGAAPNCMDKFIIGDGQQAKPESNEAVVQSSVTAKTNSAQSSASNGSTGFFKQGKKSKGQKKSSSASPEIRNYGSCS